MSDESNTAIQQQLANTERRLESARQEIIRLTLQAAGVDREFVDVAAPKYAARVLFDAQHRVDQEKLTEARETILEEIPPKFRGPATDPQYDAAAVGKAMGERQKANNNNLAYR